MKPIEPTYQKGSPLTASEYVRNGPRIGRSSIISDRTGGSRLVTRLPNRSIQMTCAATSAGAGGLLGRPREVGGFPPASRAAAGAKTSRPSKVGAAPAGRSRSTTTLGGPWRRSTSQKRPLSGPTKRQPPASNASARRGDPTPGSTTARWSEPAGKVDAPAYRTNPPATTSHGGTAC